jgi:5-formyltetrahydrofolate cyclo-ligase
MPDTDKAALRSAARRRRRELHALAPDAGREAASHLPAELGPFGTAALYWPAGSEIHPGPLAEALAERGVSLCLPAVVTRDAPVVFRPWTPGEPLAPDDIGMLAPEAAWPVIRPDLVVLPLLAFDAAGGRLGQGGGYYDRTLAQLRSQGPVFVLGLAYSGQEVERLPAEPHDEPLDAVLTETGFRAFRSNKELG